MTDLDAINSEIAKLRLESEERMGRVNSMFESMTQVLKIAMRGKDELDKTIRTAMELNLRLTENNSKLISTNNDLKDCISNMMVAIKESNERYNHLLEKFVDGGNKISISTHQKQE